MSRLASPLRYPGGKACLTSLATQLIQQNKLQEQSYAEPYSGGCGLALSLLFSGVVSRVFLNDIDRSVWAFWHAAINHQDALAERIMDARLNLDEWEEQRAVQQQKATADVLELGFSTFYLNRTNRSGIIHSGGVIGGREQTEKYKMDCRFNKPDLIKRLSRVAQYKSKIRFFNEDAEVFLRRIGSDVPSNTITYIDPPYFEKGAKLYQSAYRKRDHQRVADLISELSAPWFLTYDNVQAISTMYQRYSQIELDIGYSVQSKRRGSELLVLSESLRGPERFSRQVH